MMKFIKWVAGLLLMPAILGGVMAFLRVLSRTGDAVTFWMAALTGAALWCLVYYLLPKPMWVYVFGHELTHALWSWLFGGRVKRFKVTPKGGHVLLTRTNFLVGLAPYFFPIYAVIVMLIFLAGDLIWNWTPYRAWFHFLLGVAYAFHITLTWHILHTRQNDITEEGIFFSVVVILLGNTAVLMTAIPLLAGAPGLLTAYIWWGEETLAVLRGIRHLMQQLFG